MAFTNGTATDYHDLLDKLRLWLVGTIGWTQLEWDAPTGITDTGHLALQMPGAGPGREAYMYIATENNPATPAYAWRTSMSVGYDSLLPPASQLQASPEVYLALWQNAISYWFYATDRRVVVVTKCGTVYQSMYSGLFLPFALPSEYPRPLYLAASHSELTPHDNAEASYSMIASPVANAGWHLGREGTWAETANEQEEGNSKYGTGSSGSAAYVWPHGKANSETIPISNPVGGQLSHWQRGGFGSMRPTLADEMPLWQCQIVDCIHKSLPGALDGVFALPGFGHITEQLVTQGTRDFRVFQRSNRTQGWDYMAIEEI